VSVLGVIFEVGVGFRFYLFFINACIDKCPSVFGLLMLARKPPSTYSVFSFLRTDRRARYEVLGPLGRK